MSRYAIVLFDDGVYSFLPKKSLRYTSSSTVAKWNNTWYDVRLLCYANKEECQKIVPNLNNDIPFVDLVSFKNQAEINNKDGKLKNEEQKQSNSEIMVFADSTTDVVSTSHCDHNFLKQFLLANTAEQECEIDKEQQEINNNEEFKGATCISSPEKDIGNDKNGGQKQSDAEFMDTYFNNNPSAEGTGNVFVAEYTMDVDLMLSDYDNNFLNQFPLANTVEQVHNADKKQGNAADRDDLGREREEIDFREVHSDDDSSTDFIPDTDSSCNTSDSELLSGFHKRLLRDELQNKVENEHTVTFTELDDLNSPIDEAADFPNFERDSHSSEEITSPNFEAVSPVLQEEFPAERSFSPPDGHKKPYYTKKANFCTFCKKTNKNIERHLQQVHKDEPEVKEIIMLPKSMICKL